MVAKDNEDHIRSAIGRSGLALAGVSFVPSKRVPLAFQFAIKHWLKRTAGAVGIALVEREYAEDYWVRSLDGRTSIHCLVRGVL